MAGLLDEKTSWHYKKLMKYCCRLTKPRRAILDILSNTGKHFSAEQIYKEASKKYPNVGLASIYRNLELLIRIGLVWRFDAGHNKTMYEIVHRSDEMHHHHLICKKCKTITNYFDSIDSEKDFIREREKRLSRKYNFKIENHCIDFFGTCNKCQDSI